MYPVSHNNLSNRGQVYKWQLDSFHSYDGLVRQAKIARDLTPADECKVSPWFQLSMVVYHINEAIYLLTKAPMRELYEQSLECILSIYCVWR